MMPLISPTEMGLAKGIALVLLTGIIGGYFVVLVVSLFGSYKGDTDG